MATPQEVARSSLQTLMTCPNCRVTFNSSFRQPMQLYCGHTVCVGCLGNLPRDPQSHVICPIDRQVDIRDFDDICESHHLIDTIERTELCCINNYNDAADVYTQSGETYCQNCAHSVSSQVYPISGYDLGAYFAQLITAFMSNPTNREQAVRANPNVERRIQQMKQLTPRARQAIYFSLINRPIPTLPKPREVVPKVDENGWVILKRFHNIIPQKYCLNFDQVKRWTLTSNASQVEAVTFRPSATIRLRGLLLCKECGSFPDGYIQFIAIIEGAETHNSTAAHVIQRVNYTNGNKQTEKVTFPRPYEMRSARDYTVKVKYVGQALYFGDPSRRIDSLVGPDGVSFRVSDPKFTNGEYQNGQGALAGPIIGLLYEPTRPIS